MEYISLIVNEDAAHDCLADLGKLGVIQFTDVREDEGCGWLHGVLHVFLGLLTVYLKIEGLMEIRSLFGQMNRLDSRLKISHT